MDSSIPKQPGMRYSAIIQSMSFDPVTRSGRCLSFWYHMYGRDTSVVFVSVLTVYINNTLPGPVELWQLYGNQGNKWLPGRLPIVSASSYKVNIP